MQDSDIPDWFFRDWRDFSFRANRSFGVWEETEGWRTWRTTKDHWVLFVLVRGHVSIRLRNLSCQLQEGDMLILSPGDTGYHQDNHASSNLVARFPLELLSDGSNPLQELPPLISVPHPDLPRLQGIIERIIEMGEPPHHHSNFMLGSSFLQELMTQCILQGFNLNRYPQEPHRIAPWVDQARAFIENKHKQENLSLERIARHVGRSPRRLQQAFQEAYGVSPISFLHQHRIITARRLLATNPEFTIQYLMSRCGYRSRSMFHRMFVRFAGVPPSTFRPK